MFVANAPALDVSSCGGTEEQARQYIRDAVRGLLRRARTLGTLDEILQEAGYQRYGDHWQAPEFVAVDRLTISME